MDTHDVALEDPASLTERTLHEHDLQRQAKLRTSAEPMELARANILIIEDFSPVHDLIRTALADEPYEFLSAFDATSGLSIAKAAGVDLVLLDLDLPDFNGFDVCRQLKSDPATADIGVIFLTASAGIDEKDLGLGLEAYDYITKPFDPEELGLRIRAALRVKRLLDRLAAAEHEKAHRGNGETHPTLRHALHLSLSKVIRSRGTNLWGRQGPGRAH